MKDIQDEVRDWRVRNFGDDKDYRPVLGVCEEAGELAHSFLKMDQKIRGSRGQHIADMQDAIGDITIFLMDLCGRFGWDYELVVRKVWAEVKLRDWTKNTNTGGEVS